MKNENNQSDRQWAMIFVGRALRRLRVHWVGQGRGELFELLQEYLAHEPANGKYDKVGARFQMQHREVAMAVNRLREGYRELLGAEFRETLHDEN